MSSPPGRAFVAVLLGSMLWMAAASATQPPANPTAAAMKAFRDRADAYLSLHKKVADALPPLKETSDPQKIADREKLLGEGIRAARPGARPGDIIGEIAPLIVKAIRADLQRRTATDRKALFSEMPSPLPPLKVNDIYPSAVPLATFPPALLQTLPPLPEGLEYRFYGHHLILRDVKANVVADMLRNVIPS
jgi:hypothetical protein